MDKEEILARSRAENKNRDVYEQEVLKQAGKNAAVAQVVLVAVFFVAQIAAGGGINWGLWALVFCSNMTVSWVRAVKLHHRRELPIAIAYTALTVVMSGYHIYGLFASSAAL